jgi:hypothetical protein
MCLCICVTQKERNINRKYRGFGSPALDFKGQPLDAKVTVEMKGQDAKGAFLKKFRGHTERMHWKDFLNYTAGSCL